MDHRAEIKSSLLQIVETVKGAIASPDLASAGKLQPGKLPGKMKRETMWDTAEVEAEKASAPVGAEEDTPRAFYAEIVKAEKRLVTGLVLQPEVVDGQGDIMSADVIAQAAFDWLARFGKKTKLGLQHESFMKNETRFTLAESYVAPMEFAMGTKMIKAGTWLMTVKVLDDELWKAVKDGKITGFSIGGKATAHEVQAK
jgi:hypothetical protein